MVVVAVAGQDVKRQATRDLIDNIKNTGFGPHANGALSALGMPSGIHAPPLPPLSQEINRLASLETHIAASHTLSFGSPRDLALLAVSNPQSLKTRTL